MRVGLSMGEEEKLHHQNNTDNVVHNLDLSQQRTNAVKTQLVNMGIDEFSLHTIVHYNLWQQVLGRMDTNESRSSRMVL
jgi:hypothetical protein